MPAVRLLVLGVPRAETEGQQLEIRPSRPALLLLFLALEGDWVSRERLAWLFRPDATEEQARANLRLLLNRAKRLSWASALEVERKRVRFPVRHDLADDPFADGILLEGWEPDGPLHEWLEAEREKQAARFRRRLLDRVRELQEADRHAEALPLLRDFLLREPLAEDALQAFLRSSIPAAARTEALQLWEAFRARLKDELGLDPLPETLALAGLLTTPAAASGSQELPAAAAAGAELPFTGRGPELRRAEQLRPGTLLVVDGESGSGKTRFLRHLLRDRPQLWLRGREGLGEIAWLPVLQALRGIPELALRVRSLPEAWQQELRVLLPELPGGPAAAPAGGGRALEAVAALLGSLAGAEGELTVVFDDARWLDPHSRQLLFFLAAGSRVHVCAAGFSGDEHAGGQPLLHVVLPPLSRPEISALAEAVNGSPPDRARLGQLQRQSGGNPLFLRELLVNPDGTTAPGKPGQAVRRRLSGLSRGETAILRGVAIMDGQATVPLLARLSGLGEAAAAGIAGRLEKTGLLQSGEFVHGLIRSAVLEDMPHTVRQHLHRQAARLLKEVAADPLLVAEHLAGAGQTEEAAELWFSEASQRFSRQPGFEREAEQLYRRIIAAGVKGPAAARARAYLAGRLRVQNDVAGAWELIRTVLRESGDDLARSFSLSQAAVLHYLDGDLGEAERCCRQALAQAAGLTYRELHDDLQMLYSILLHARQRYAEALAVSSRMVERHRLRPPGFPLANWLNRKAADLCALGRYGEALALYREQLEVARHMRQPRQQVLAANDILATLDDLGRVGEGLELGLEARALGDFDVTWPLLYHLALARRARGDEAGARRDLSELLAGTPSVNTRSWALALEAELAATDGDAAAATAAVAEALTLTEGTELGEARAAVALAAARYGAATQREEGLRRLRALVPEELPARLRQETEAILGAVAAAGTS